MYCRQCGRQIPDDSKYCPLCGAMTVSETPAGQASPPEEKKVYDSGTPSGREASPPPGPAHSPPPPPSPSRSQLHYSAAAILVWAGVTLAAAGAVGWWAIGWSILSPLIWITAAFLIAASLIEGIPRRALGLIGILGSIGLIYGIGITAAAANTTYWGNISYYGWEVDTPLLVVSCIGCIILLVLGAKRMAGKKGVLFRRPAPSPLAGSPGGMPAMAFGVIAIAIAGIIIGYPIYAQFASPPIPEYSGNLAEGSNVPARMTTPPTPATTIPSPTIPSTTQIGSNGGVVVATGKAPEADFTATTVSGPAPLTVRFTDLSTGSPTDWVWNFGDGMTSADQDPVHTFVRPGIYTVTLRVTNGGGSGIERKADYISVTSVVTTTATMAATTTPPTSVSTTVSRAAQHLEPDWRFEPQSGPAPLIVHFTDLTTGNPTSWHWVFGDGSSSDEQNPVHTYTVPGTYQLSYTVGNDLDIAGGPIGTITVTSVTTPASTAACSVYSYVINGQTQSGSCCGVLSSSIECPGGACSPVYTCDGLPIL